VIRLQRVNLSESGVELKEPVGTGFFVAYKDALYLVSAGHLSKAGDLRARLPVGELSVPRQAWVVHPSAKSVDVAVARVACPVGLKLNTLRFEDELATADPQPPEQILVAGYPRGFAFDAATQRPMIRQGIVSMMGDAPYVHYAGDQSMADGRVRVLDVRTFPGNSGSPVFRQSGFPGKRVLVGLVSSGDEELGIAISEPVSRIRETIEFAYAAKGAAEGLIANLRQPTGPNAGTQQE
jgi:Trypsin-like peptidase domain